MSDLKLNTDGLLRLLRFMRERHQVYVRRFVEKRPAPWTEDPILQTYKFTNVYRELDRVTIWIREHIREPFAGHPDLWFMLAAARQINLPATLQELTESRSGAWPHRPGRWDYRALARVLLARKARGEPVYTGAYMLTCQPPELVRDGEKAWFTAEVVLKRVWDARRTVEPQLHSTLAAAHAAFLPYHGWGDFLTAQVVADLKYTQHLRSAPDWWDWAVLGPGSKRGLNRVLGRELTAGFQQDQALELLREIREEHARVHKELPPLCLQNVQNVLCEFDKYERVRLGEGRPRSRYPGTGTV